MNYTPDQFFALSEAIADDGGLHLDEMCKARQYTFTGGDKIKPAMLPGCGNLSIFDIPYEGEDGKPHHAKLCAVCDNVALMPRYVHVLRGF